MARAVSIVNKLAKIKMTIRTAIRLNSHNLRNMLVAIALFLSCSANTQKPDRISDKLTINQKPTLRKDNDDCKDITELQIILDGEERLDWDSEDLELPTYLSRISFIDSTKGYGYNGKVCEFDKNGEISVQGFLNYGKVDGRWIVYRTYDDKRYIEYDLEFDIVNGEVRYKRHKYFHRHEVLGGHLEHIEGDLYVDSSFTYEPYSDSLPQYYLSWVRWGKGPGRGNFNQTDKWKMFDRKGNLISFYLDDSIYIRWYESELDRIFSNSCALDNGLCIGIVKGKIEKFYKLTKGERHLEIVGGFRFEQVKDSFYLEYEVYGKKNSISVILN